MDFRIALCGWEESANTRKLIEKIRDKLVTMSEDILSINIVDLKTEEAPEVDIYITFGDLAYTALADKEEVYKCPKTTLMFSNTAQSYKTEAFNILKEVVETISRAKKIQQRELYVETNNGTTVGLNANIKITTEEAEYLKTIKDIVGGGTIVIKYGNQEIRIEDERRTDSN